MARKRREFFHIDTGEVIKNPRLKPLPKRRRGRPTAEAAAEWVAAKAERGPSRVDFLRGAELVGVPRENFLPHPAKAFFRKRGVPVWAVAKVVGISLAKMGSILNGHIEPSFEIEVKLRDLMNTVKVKLGEKKPAGSGLDTKPFVKRGKIKRPKDVIADFM